ncbi:MAG: D-glycero-beta-D-manno-heptose 1,7-bisphosphate 7-phosphatase [Immundisolibacter sp.]
MNEPAVSPNGTRRWVVLDRDGVINRDSPDYIRSPTDWQPLPGALTAIARLSAAGFGLAVASNQSGIGRGYLDRPTLEAIHARLHEQVTAAGGRLAAIAYCPHTPADRCACRKPRPGLLKQLMAECGFAANDALMIGDSARDIEAARAAGMAALAVGADAPRLGADFGVPTFADLARAADWLLEGNWPC